MKIIFLDIDGVLNTHHKERDDFGQLFRPECCEALKVIIEATGAKIIISSTWRHAGAGKMAAMWKHRKLAGEVIGITPDLTHKKGAIWVSPIRGDEIQAMLQVLEIHRYVIIDDDKDMRPEQKPFFVQTVGHIGLTMDDANKAIEILNQKT